jgi:importin subunit alpha-2
MTINVQEMRRSHTEVNVELRKAKKEDHLLKRRNLEVDDEEPLSPLQEQIRMAAANMTIEDIVNGEFLNQILSGSYLISC